MPRRVSPSFTRPGIARLLWLLPACVAPLVGCSGAATPASAPISSSSPPPAASPPETPETEPTDSEAYHQPEDLTAPIEPAEPMEGVTPAHPLDDWPTERIEQAVKEAPEELGCMSLGSPSGGLLLNGMRMPESDRWELVDPAHAWGTRETIDYLTTAIDAVHAAFPNTPKLHIGHISGKNGGHLRPHISHQSGRDVDISFFYSDESSGWYARARAKNLDVARTWAFVRALVIETDVEMILIDHSIQRLLREHALAKGEDPAWVHGLFAGGGGRRAIIRHAPGHATHLHIRFFNPVAQETARRAYPFLVEAGRIKPPTYYVSHRVKKGETLIGLSKKYGASVKAIQRANNLRGTLIQARKVYRIPRTGSAAASSKPVTVPPRRLPPEREQPSARSRARPSPGSETRRQ